VGEFVSKHDILVADWNGLSPVERIIKIPVSAARWTLLITPFDSGPASDPTADLEYDIGNDQFLATNPASSVVAVIGTANVVTREDVVNRIKLKLTPSVAAPNGNSGLIGVAIRLLIARR